ncbi:MAG: M15 family metallopeptidase [Hyphomicrobiaceae bacterium]|nr:M15 family metallopeptidase [Hyphomicrobiaceae bacterium]
MVPIQRRVRTFGLTVLAVASIGATETIRAADDVALAPVSAAPPVDHEAIGAALRSGYPGIVAAVGADAVTFADGTEIPLDDGVAGKDGWARLQASDVEDMFAVAYRVGATGPPAHRDDDPGRARSAGFFGKVYGDCAKGEVEADLVDVAWLASRQGGVVRVTKRNGVASSLERVSAELDRLSPSMTDFLVPPAQGYACRPIAGTERASAHGYGIAIDINAASADYWRWTRADERGAIAYRNAIPSEIVAIFEAHGWIWGGKWYHYDTMHFEYRPELIAFGRQADRR